MNRERLITEDSRIRLGRGTAGAMRWRVFLAVVALVGITGSNALPAQTATDVSNDPAPEDEVTLVVSNASGWDITVRGIPFGFRSGSGIAFEAEVPAKTVRRVGVPSNAVKDRPMAIDILRGSEGMRQDRYRVNGRLTLRRGSILWLDVPDDMGQVAARVLEAPTLATNEPPR